MAERNANIGVKIGGDVTPLQNSLKKAEASLANFTGMAKGAANNLVKLSVASGIAAAGGLAVIYKSTAASAKEIKNLSSLANVSVETMQRMSYAAGTVDVSMEKMADILKDTNDKMGDFSATGGGAMADFFENIAPQVGLTISQFKRLSGDEALQAYYNALEKANLSQQDMTFYMEAIASDSTALIPLLKNNGAALRAMAAEADDLGAVLSSIDIAQIEAANKEFKRAGGVIRGAGQAISVELAPYVEAAVNKFVQMSKEAGGFGSIVEDSFSKAGRVVVFVADAVRGLEVIFKGLHVAAAGVGTGIVVVFNGVVQSVDDLMRSMIDGVNTVTEQLNRLPKVNIDMIGYPEFGRAVDDITQLSVANLQMLASEFNALAMQPLPSEGVEQFLNTIKEKSKEAAAEVAAISKASFAEDKQESALGEDPKMKALKERYLTEEELLRQHRETMSMIGEEYDASQFSSEEQWREVRAQAISEHVDAVSRIRQAEKVNAINIASSMANSVMSLAQGQSKKAFELSKKVAIASAVIDGYKAATSAWAAGMATGGPWAPAIAAAYTVASLAKTGAQINAIKSQSFSGGGGQSDAGGSSFPTTGAASGGGGGGAIGGGSGGGNAGSVAINLPAGAIIRGDALLDMIEEAVNNGKSVNFLRA